MTKSEERAMDLIKSFWKQDKEMSMIILMIEFAKEEAKKAFHAGHSPTIISQDAYEARLNYYIKQRFEQ